MMEEAERRKSREEQMVKLAESIVVNVAKRMGPSVMPTEYLKNAVANTLTIMAELSELRYRGSGEYWSEIAEAVMKLH